MDRRIATRDQLPTETEFMEAQRFGYEAFGHFMHDVLGAAPLGQWAFGFACAQTTVPGLSFLLGPGRLYAPEVLDATAMGQILGLGGLGADTDTDHKIFKQGLWRDTATLGPLVAPTTSGQSQVFLVEGQWATADDAVTLTQFYNVDDPDEPISENVTLYRRDLVSIQIKNGIAATTGNQVCPNADSGWVPLWAITLANGDTTITSSHISQAPGAPFQVVGSPVPVQETVFTAAPVAGVLTIDWSKGNYCVVAMTAAITSVAYLNAPAAGKAQTLVVEFVGNGTGQTMTGLAPSAVLAWLGNGATGTQPTFMSASGARNKCVLVLHDGGAKADWSYSGSAA
jgi:hypothetical protein